MRSGYLTYFFAQESENSKPYIVAQKFYKAPERTKIYKKLYQDLQDDKYFKIGWCRDIKDMY